jgi:hypothetical protein
VSFLPVSFDINESVTVNETAPLEDSPLPLATDEARVSDAIFDTAEFLLTDAINQTDFLAATGSNVSAAAAPSEAPFHATASLNTSLAFGGTENISVTQWIVETQNFSASPTHSPAPTATDRPGLSAGEIAGVVIGSIALAAIAAGGLIWHFKFRRPPIAAEVPSSESPPEVNFVADALLTGSTLHASLLTESATYEGGAGRVPPIWNGVPAGSPPVGDFWQI